MKYGGKILFYFWFFVIIQGSPLYSSSSWPTSLKELHFWDASNSIKMMYEETYIKICFNRGYNSGSLSDSIPGKLHDTIIGLLNHNLNKALSEAVTRVKNCSAFNKLFGEEAKKKLPTIKNDLTFLNLPNGKGTITDMGFFAHYQYLGNFMFHAGKQAREIENGQRKDFDLTPGHFDVGAYNDKVSIPIVTNLAHELMHVLSGFNGGGREAECIVHCLTRKCVDSNWDFKDTPVPLIDTKTWKSYSGDISCNKIPGSFWKGKENVSNEMKPGDCFCGLKWVETANCSDNNPPTPPGSRKDKKIGQEWPDDNYSYSPGINALVNIFSTSIFNIPLEGDKDFIGLNFFPETLIFEKFFYGDFQALLDRYGFYYMDDYVHDYFSNHHKILCIGSAVLMGEEKSEIVKNALRNFVDKGGVLLVLSAQYGRQVENLVPIPEGEPLKYFGFREDQSCLKNSAYSSCLNPITSSSTKELLDVGLDGYIPVYPSGSTVILRRRINQEPALLYYPYGQGTVILTSLFTDYAFSRSMAGTAELKIFRDLITFAKSPLPVPMYDLNLDPNPGIALDPTVRNSSEEIAAKVVLKAYTPDRNRVLYEIRESIALNPGEETQIPVQFSLPSLENGELGICHTDYELYDQEDNLIQLPTESVTGRFSVYKIIETYTHKTPVDAWITVKEEEVYFTEAAEMTFHLRNNTAQARTVDLKYSWNHEITPTFLQTVTLQPHQLLELTFNIDAPSSQEFLSNANGGTVSMRFRLWYDAHLGNPNTQVTKGITFKTPGTDSSYVQIQPKEIKVGTPFSYSVHVTNAADITLENTAISLTLEKLEWPANNYIPVKKIYETTHTFSKGEIFTYEGTYAPDPQAIHKSGMYRMKLRVDTPGGSKEEYYGNFFYLDSNIGLKIDPLPKDYLMPGSTYQVKITLAKLNNVPVLNGRYAIIFKTPDGQDACRKESGNIAIPGNQTLSIDETVTFQPTVLAPYYLLWVEYTDETMLTPKSASSGQRYLFKYRTSLKLDKEVYLFPETANITLEINGNGTFDVHFTCPAAGIDEQRAVTVPPGSVQVKETFAVPIGLSATYIAQVEVTSREGYYSTRSGPLNRLIPHVSVQVETDGRFGAVTARESEPLDFYLDIKGIAGFVVPLTGELKVTAPELGYENLQTVSIAPQGNNSYTYSIPVPADTAAGTYGVTVTFQVEGRTLLSRGFSIQLPAAGIEPAELATDLTAGETYSLVMTNPGGKDGHYEISGNLKDRQGKTLLDFNHTPDIAAGEQAELPLTLPSTLAGGTYILTQHVKETHLNREITHYSQHRVIGPEASLKAYTTKETYFAGETVTGKSEITAGAAAIENSTLYAEILKPEPGKALEKIYDDVHCLTTVTTGTQNRLWVGTTGIARYDETGWQEFPVMPDGSDIGIVEVITAGPDGKVYALAETGIITVDSADNADSPNLEVISYRYGAPQRTTAAVDKLSRVWMCYYGEMITIAYYDQTGWNTYNYSTVSPEVILCDTKGGVWLVYETKLTHVNADLTSQTWTSSTGLPTDGIYSPYVDIDGTVWFTTPYTYELYSFNGTTWTDYSSNEGCPPNGMITVTGDETGQIYGIGINENWHSQVYTLENSQWIEIGEEFYASYDGKPTLTAANGYLYTNGTLITGNEGEGEGGETVSGLLKIGGSSGTGLKSLWNQTYSTINVSPGTTAAIDLNPDQTLAPGYYILHTQLKSSLDQVLALSRNAFVVRDTAVSVSMNLTTEDTEGTESTGIMTGCFVKKDTPLHIVPDCLNNTSENKDNLQLTVKKTSPGGIDTDMLDQTLNLLPGQSYTDTLEFKEAETGTWIITARIIAGDVVLSGSEIALAVVEPKVRAEISSPAAAGNDPFTIDTRLTNQGVIDAEVTCVITGTGTAETLLLNPGEERIVRARATITDGQDFTYTVTLSGDMEKTETRTVKYGYTAQLTVQVQPLYREGLLSIPYEIVNTGGLPFSGTVNFKLYGAGGIQPGIPLASADRGYNLYPGAASQTGTLSFELPAGNYILTYNTPGKTGQEQEQPFTIQPSGLGTLTLLSQSMPVKTPVGSSEIRYQVTNSDTAAGSIPVQVVFTYGGTQIQAETREYYLQPGETTEDEIAVSCTQPGSYSLLFTGGKLAGPVQCPIQVLPLDAVTASLETGEPGNGSIPVTVTIINNGYRDFTGQVVLEVEGKVNREPVTVVSGSRFDGTFRFETGALSAGGKEFHAYLYDEAGQVQAEKTSAMTIRGADVQVLEVPQNLTIAAGSSGMVSMKIKNQGDLSGEVLLKLTAFDNFYREYPVTLAPGQETELADMILDIEGDIPTGNYPVHYTITGPGTSGTSGGIRAGNFYVKVEGLALEVGASLDRSLYNPGETAALTLDVSSTAASTSSAVPLEAVVNWGNFSETRPFTLENSSASLVFNIPLDEARADKVFYGIYHEEGKGIHLNDIYLNFKGGIDSGGISVELDKQVYAPGEIVHAVFTSENPGVITAGAFEESYTLNLSGSASAGFQVPAGTLGGTYGIDWSFEPIAAPNTSNTSNLSDSILTGVSGSHPFDVSGLVVKTAKAELERGKYAPGETLKAYYIFESNRDQVLELRSWSMTPTGAWEYLGESSVTVSGSRQVDGLSSYSFTTTEAGPHRLVYGLYREEELVVSGSMAFDVGDAVMLGISPDQQEYKTGAEPVKLRVDYFGQGAAQMEVYLDGESFIQQGIALSGIGSTEIILDGSRIPGGTHTIKGVFTQDGLTSAKTTQIIYGTELPDLVINLVDTERDGLNYTYKLEIVNQGKTGSGATEVVFSDNGVEIGTVNIPPLEPRGAGGLLAFTSSMPNFSNHPSSTTPGSTLSPLLRAKSQELRAQVSFYWTGSGKAGAHELVFEVDKSGTVKEFSEVDNRVEITEEVPALFYSLEMNPPELFTYPANTPMSIVTRLINNRESPLQLNLDLSITNDETGVIVHNRTQSEQLAAFESKSITDIFNTGTYPAGSYCITQTFTGENESIQREVSIMLESTAIITGAFQVQPRQIPANISTEVQLALDLKNDGNISLENEILHLDIFNKEAGEVELSEEMAVAISYGEEISMTKALTLNLAAGNYEIWLKHGEEIIATAELSAAAAIKPSITVDIRPRVLLLLPSAIFSREDTRRDAKNKVEVKVEVKEEASFGQLFNVFGEAPASMHLSKESSLKSSSCNHASLQPCIPTHFGQGNVLSLRTLTHLFTILSSESISIDTGFGPIDSYIKFHKGQANVNIIIGNEMAHWLRDELKERIWRGEGLILRCDKPVQNPDWKDFLGVTLKPIPGHRRETVVQVLPNEFSSGGEIQLQEKVDLQIIPEQNDVIIVAQTKQGHFPVMAYRKYGKGDILVITMPLEISQGQEVMAQLLINAINRYSRDIYSNTVLTRQMPIEISIKNETPGEKELTVKALLPYGVEVFDSEPKPGPGEELKWKLTIPGTSTAEISAWLSLPDKIGTYEVKIELYEGEILAAEESMTWEVSQAVLAYINEMIREIGGVEAEGKDKQRIRKEVDHLEKIRSRIGDEMTDYLMNLQDAVQAAGYIGEVEDIDVSEQRQKALEIMFVMGRWFYGKVILLPHPSIIHR